MCVEAGMKLAAHLPADGKATYCGLLEPCLRAKIISCGSGLVLLLYVVTNFILKCEHYNCDLTKLMTEFKQVYIKDKKHSKHNSHLGQLITTFMFASYWVTGLCWRAMETFRPTFNRTFRCSSFCY